MAQDDIVVNSSFSNVVYVHFVTADTLYFLCIPTGAFVGVSLEGNVVATRMDTNLRFYGDPYLTPSDILLGTVDRPKAAEPLYASLEDLFSSVW